MSAVRTFSVPDLGALIQKIKKYEPGIVEIIQNFCNSDIIKLEKGFDKYDKFISSISIHNLDAIDCLLRENYVFDSEYLLSRDWWSHSNAYSIMIRHKMIKTIRLGLGECMNVKSGNICYHLNDLINFQLSYYPIIDITSFKILMKVGGIMVDKIPSETILAYWNDKEIRNAIISIVSLGDGEQLSIPEVDLTKEKKILKGLRSYLVCNFMRHLYYDIEYYDIKNPEAHPKNPEFLSKVISVNCLNCNNYKVLEIVEYILNNFNESTFSKFMNVMNIGIGFMITWTPDMAVLVKNMDEVLEVKFKEDEGKTDQEKGYSISKDGDINFIY